MLTKVNTISSAERREGSIAECTHKPDSSTSRNEQILPPRESRFSDSPPKVPAGGRTYLSNAGHSITSKGNEGTSIEFVGSMCIYIYIQYSCVHVCMCICICIYLCVYIYTTWTQVQIRLKSCRPLIFF